MKLAPNKFIKSCHGAMEDDTGSFALRVMLAGAPVDRIRSTGMVGMQDLLQGSRELKQCENKR